MPPIKKPVSACFLSLTLFISFFIPCASYAADEYVAGININGQDSSSAQSSGTLPGTSPSVHEPLLRTKDGRPIPLWYDGVFPPLDPTLVEQTKKLLEDKKKILRTTKAKTYSTGEQKSFWVKDDADTGWRQVAATVKRTGAHSYIFVDDTVSIPDASLDLYVTEFEIMYSVLAANIGIFTDRDDNNKVAILLYDINDGGTANTGYYGGYFWNKDYYADDLVKASNLRSNEMDIIYIRGREPSGWTAEYGDFYGYNLTTLVHEYEHLVQFGLLAWSQGTAGTSSDAWIDEMMAMASETMYFKEKLRADPSYTHDDMLPGGYLSSRIEYYTQDKRNSIRNGHGLTYWNNNGDVLANYALSYLFGQYLSLQATSGQGIFKDILNYIRENSIYNYQAVAGAVSGKISGAGSWEDLLRLWAIANMLNSASGPSGYAGAFAVTAHGPITNKVLLNSGGIVYRKLDSAWSAPADAGSDIIFFIFDSAGNTGPADTTTTTTISRMETTTTTNQASSTTTIIQNDSTTTTSPANPSTTTTIDAACSNPAYPADCMAINGGCCPENTPICCTSGCCPTDLPYCGADGTCHSLPQTPQDICPFEALLGQSSPSLDTLRRLRDDVLSASKEGRRSSILFYRHAFELNAIFHSRPALREKAYKLISELLPAAEELILNKKAAIKNRSAQELLSLLEDLSAQAGPSLKQDFAEVQKELRSGNIFKAFHITISAE